MTNTQAPPSSTLGPGVTCPKCGSTYPARNVHHCATFTPAPNVPQVVPGYIPLPGVPPQAAPFPRLVTGAEVDALRAEVAALRARVAELEGRG